MDAFMLEYLREIKQINQHLLTFVVRILALQHRKCAYPHKSTGVIQFNQARGVTLKRLANIKYSHIRNRHT